MPNPSIIIKSIVAFVGFAGLYLACQRRKGVISKSDILKEEKDMKLQNRVLYDLTAAITTETTVFPGDPCFKRKQVATLGDSGHFNLYEMSMCNHLGTHIDFPAHVIKDGKTSSDYDLNDLMGNGLIIEIPKEDQAINKRHIEAEQKKIFENSIVFFKTNNSTYSKSGPAFTGYVYIEPEAAELLVKLKVKIVGIDYLSVDSDKYEEIPVHKIFLSNNILIVENLDLKNVTSGLCSISIVPPKILDMDGLPVRAFMLR